MNSSALNTKQCPKCHTDNPALARFCRHCRYEFPEATITGGSLSPEIKSFKIREDKYWKGSVVHIEWKVDNANIVMINDVDVTSMSDFEITVDSATTLTISAENDYDKASKSLRLSPHSLPSNFFLIITTKHIVQSRNKTEMEHTQFCKSSIKIWK